MKKIVTTLLIVCLISLSSCKNEKKTEGPTQMEQVMDIHDEVMPKMGTIGKLIGQLGDKIEQTDTPDPYIAARKDLRIANKAMMDWMKDFGNSFDSDEIMKGKALSDEKQKILDQQEIAVDVLRDQINTSIANAQNLLK
jgi:hypothetical protein